MILGPFGELVKIFPDGGAFFVVEDAVDHQYPVGFAAAFGELGLASLGGDGNAEGRGGVTQGTEPDDPVPEQLDVPYRLFGEHAKVALGVEMVVQNGAVLGKFDADVPGHQRQEADDPAAGRPLYGTE